MTTASEASSNPRDPKPRLSIGAQAGSGRTSSTWHWHEEHEMLGPPSGATSVTGVPEALASMQGLSKRLAVGRQLGPTIRLPTGEGRSGKHFPNQECSSLSQRQTGLDGSGNYAGCLRLHLNTQPAKPRMKWHQGQKGSTLCVTVHSARTK